MDSFIKTLTYRAKRFRLSYLIFVAIMLGIDILSKIMSVIFGNGSQGNNAQDAVFLIYSFVYFIAIFKDSFNHLSMNGITRKVFFLTNSIFIVAVSIIMVITSYILSLFNSLIGIHSELLLNMVYNSSYLELFILGLSFSVLASFVGWLCSLLTYRFGNYMILIIIFVPQILMTVFAAVVSKIDKVHVLLNFVRYYFGMAEGIHPYTASLNLLLTAIAVGLINWLFMRKLSVKV